MPTPAFLSQYNGFIAPATEQAIAYVMEPGRFKLTQYVQFIKAEKPIVRWAFLDPDEPARVVSDADYAWPDGQMRPEPKGNMGNFLWTDARTTRRNYGYTIGQEALDNADWNARAFFNSIQLSKAMINKTNRIITMLQTTANWGGNYASADTLSGLGAGNGKWTTASSDPSAPQYLAIRKSIMKALTNITLATNGAVQPADLKLIVSPNLAQQMSSTSEINNYLKSSPSAIQVLNGQILNPNVAWGLPPDLYGIPVVVEDTVIVNSPPNASGTLAVAGTDRNFVKNDTTAILVSRVGGVRGNYGAPSFSTVQCFFFKYELAIEAELDAYNKLHRLNVVEQFHEVIPAPQSGFLITGVS